MRPKEVRSDPRASVLKSCSSESKRQELVVIEYKTWLFIGRLEMRNDIVWYGVARRERFRVFEI